MKKKLTPHDFFSSVFSFFLLFLCVSTFSLICLFAFFAETKKKPQQQPNEPHKSTRNAPKWQRFGFNAISTKQPKQKNPQFQLFELQLVAFGWLFSVFSHNCDENTRKILTLGNFVRFFFFFFVVVVFFFLCFFVCPYFVALLFH